MTPTELTLGRLMCVFSLALCAISPRAIAQDLEAILERLNALEENQRIMQQQIADRDARIHELEEKLGVTSEDPTQELVVTPVDQSARTIASATVPARESSAGQLLPNGGGYRLIDSEDGTLNFGAWAYVRYLNNLGLDDDYTDSFGREFQIDSRNDVQFNKVNLTFSGWVHDPNFQYLLYTWTSNSSQGESAQVVVAGNLRYRFGDGFTAGFGIEGLPGTHSTSGTFPRWLKVDHRPMADTFFQPSYTTGVFATGAIGDRARYKMMLGNNLSQLGVNANKLDDGFNTFSGRIDWMPTTGEFGPGRGIDDFEMHDRVATLAGLAFTYSEEDRQSQPGTEDINNSQIRLSDGTLVFNPNAFNTQGRVNEATYQMAAAVAGMKYMGFSLLGEYYWRWVDDFDTEGFVPEDELFDHGFQLQSSYMLVPRSLQAYVTTSKIFGEYGDPWDASIGLNWFPFRERLVRVNGELIYMDDSPVGYSSIPYSVGGEGVVFHTNLEMKF